MTSCLALKSQPVWVLFNLSKVTQELSMLPWINTSQNNNTVLIFEVATFNTHRSKPFVFVISYLLHCFSRKSPIPIQQGMAGTPAFSDCPCLPPPAWSVHPGNFHDTAWITAVFHAEVLFFLVQGPTCVQAHCLPPFRRGRTVLTFVGGYSFHSFLLLSVICLNGENGFLPVWGGGCVRYFSL